ncbi:transposase family protein [Streptomyces sp. NPDC086549]|uniref:transposase family protein n=1 Tax=Streptomyces sp. NPDC086549 TaxID=3365752 RepID=UPI0037FA88E8
MRDVNSLARRVFSGLPALVVEDVTDEGEVIHVSARPRQKSVRCPLCGMPTVKMHGFRGRTVADMSVDSRRVVVSMQVRRVVRTVLRARPHLSEHADRAGPLIEPRPVDHPVGDVSAVRRPG